MSGSHIKHRKSEVGKAHYMVKDLTEVRSPQNLRGRAIMCRHADDWVCAFQYREDARRFYTVLPKRLGKYGLETEPSKTKIIRFSRFHPSRKRGPHLYIPWL